MEIGRFFIFTAVMILLMNRGDDQTFINTVWREVIDLTLCTGAIELYLRKSRLFKETLISDHRCIKFEWHSERSTAKSYRNPMHTNWEHYRTALARELSNLNLKYKISGRTGRVGGISAPGHKTGLRE